MKTDKSIIGERGGGGGGGGGGGSKDVEMTMRIANFWRQILILSWKNLIIFRCNLFGTLLEFLSPFVFLAFLLIIRYYIERIRFNTSAFVQPTSVFDISFFLMNQTRNLVIFYPNTTLVRNFVLSAVQLLKFRNPTFEPKGF